MSNKKAIMFLYPLFCQQLSCKNGVYSSLLVYIPVNESREVYVFDSLSECQGSDIGARLTNGIFTNNLKINILFYQL